MKITIYELLGKVKDDIKTDIYVKYFNKISQKEDIMWACKENIIYKLDQKIIELNDEIEIIEEVEDKEYEDIEEIGNLLYCENQVESILHRKIDALIRNQKKIIEVLNDKDKDN